MSNTLILDTMNHAQRARFAKVLHGRREPRHNAAWADLIWRVAHGEGK